MLNTQCSIIREQFPILATEVYGRPLAYLDNAATTQKPRCVVEAERDQYYTANANVHRGVHYLSQQATDLLEQARVRVASFINAPSEQEIIFTRGTTEAVNLVASSYGQLLKEGDEVIISEMEHHSNIVPWQLLRDRRGIVLKVIPFCDDGILDLNAYKALFTDRTRMVSITHVSNVLGTVNPVQEMIRVAHSHGVPVLVDAAQSVPHFRVDVQQLDCDFLAFSGHKVYGPTGIGALYGRSALLEQMPPYQGGGEMISTVSFDRTTFEDIPYKFEAGTPNYVGAHALAVALDYIDEIGLDNIADYESRLTRYATERLSAIPDLRIFGNTPGKGAVISFLVGDIHHLDMGTLLDRLGIAVRTGHHCAQLIMTHYGVEGMVRASFSFYNTEAEIDALAEGIIRVAKMLQK
ncbi:MAG: cysteine desulfurase [Bacteroidaceae bacterium]|nr:cysteine desulfurase [Bacteroidaceae bacterium]